MAVGQAVLTSVLDVGALNAVETRLVVQGVAVCEAHAVLLREVLELRRVLTQAGAGLAVVPQAALLLQVSEQAAQLLLVEAQLLASLPGGLEALECGLLTVGQSAVLRRAVADLDAAVQLQVWGILQARLLSAAGEGVVLPPARMASLLTRWVAQADPVGVQERRRRAEAGGDVSYRRREDGLGDLFATGVPAPLLQAVLCRVRAAAQPFGSQDERSAGKRRLDALLDLLLGRQPLPPADDAVTGRCPTAAERGCRCRPGTAVPCGAEVLVHVPVGAALGTTDELAELVGHGPLHPDQLEAVLRNGPRVRVVRVDDAGVPVSTDGQVVVAPVGDLDGVRRRIRELAAGPPGPAQPRHPFDHPHTPLGVTSDVPLAAAAGPRLRAGAHPPDAPGPYRVPRRLRRLVQIRAPRCEWPGCGVRAQACDVDHDRAHPFGATCACNTGPLCRRHHRVKQLLMTKTRVEASAVVWTGPTGRAWTSPAQHVAPARTVRPQPVTHGDEHDLSPQALAELLADPDQDDERALQHDPDPDTADSGTDRIGDAIRADDDGWGHALDDPYRWTP